MTMISEIQTILSANNTECTEEQITAFIEKAKALINLPILTPQRYTDYQKEFEGDEYITKHYPLIEYTLTIKVNDNIITPDYVDYNTGIIYLDRTYNGTLTAIYTVGISEDEVEADLIPIVVTLIQQDTGQNLASITEGDVSISYKTSNNGVDETSLDSLISKFRSKYDTLIRWV